MVPPADLERLSHAELKSLVISQLEMIAELRRTVAALRDEIAHLKRGPRPSRHQAEQTERNGEDKVTDSKQQGPLENVATRGPTRTKLTGSISSR
jgi:hypothetical protein